MANTKQYLSHLLQNTGITPACSEEERAAADVIAKIFSDHGFTPQVQEFSASGTAKVVQGVLGVVVFIGAVLMGIGGPAGMIGLLLTLAAAILFALERSGRPVLSGLGSGGLSQNVIAYHKASGPLASPRNRPVVVVAHYDSPREDLLAREPFAAYRPLIIKLLPVAMLAPAVVACVRMFPIPDAAKTVLWVLAILIALVPLVNGVAILANRFVLPYTTGSVSNKSSVAAMLGVMDAVAPYELGDEFPRDVPADEYFAEQQRILDEAIAAAEAAAAAEAEAAMSYPHELEADGDDEWEDGDSEPEPAVGLEVVEGTLTDMPQVDVPDHADEDVMCADLGATMVTEPLMDAVDAEAQAEPEDFDAGATVTNMPVIVDRPLGDEISQNTGAVVEEAPFAVDGQDGASLEMPVQPSLDLDAAAPEPKLPFYVNAVGNVRFGSDVIRGLGMLPTTCSVVYEPGAEPEPELPTAFEVEHEDREIADDAVRPVVPVAPEAELEYADEQVEVVFEDEAFAAPVDMEEEPLLDAEEAPGAEADESPSFESDWAQELIEVAEPVEPAFEEGFDDIMEAEYEIIEDEEEESDSTTVQDDALSSEPSGVDRAEDSGDNGAAEVRPSETVELVSSDFDGTPADERGGDRPEADISATVAHEALTPKKIEAAGNQAGTVDQQQASGSTEVFNMGAAPQSDAPADLSGTIAMPMPPSPAVETVDSLMAEIAQPAPSRPQRTIGVPSTVDAPVPHTPQMANRSSLFDLPDPSATPVDPFAVSDQRTVAGRNEMPVVREQRESAFTVVETPAPVSPAVEERFETISASAPVEEKPRRGLGKLFGRKKKNDDSMSDWLGVDESFDAKTSGHDIGSWDNFDDGWKGGAAVYEGASEEEMREAIASMGDDELLGHDIWFVATGASENGHAGIRAFLDEHRDKLRGVFLINLESVGAGQLAMLATEGEERVLKGDKRIMKLVRQVSSDFHRECATVDMPYVTTDAHVAMGMSLRSLTVAGVDSTGFALSHTEEDQPYNVDTDNVAFVSDVVAEVIRRS